VLIAGLLSITVVAASAPTVHHTPSFRVINRPDSAQVFPLNANIPTKLWKKACRKALSYPLKVRKQQLLAKQLNLDLPKGVYFVNSQLTDYQENKIDNGINCSGKVKEVSPDLGRSTLALMNAWRALEQEKIEFLKPLLQISMANDATRNDAIVLIATHEGGSKRQGILEQQADDTKLLLDDSKIALSDFWIEQGKYQSALDLLKDCDHPQCYQLQRKVSREKELQDEKTADDLASYF
jgi:hypothetical protein